MSDPRTYMQHTYANDQAQQGSSDGDMAELFTPKPSDPDAPRIYTRSEKLAWIVSNRWLLVAIGALTLAVVAYGTGALKM